MPAVDLEFSRWSLERRGLRNLSQLMRSIERARGRKAIAMVSGGEDSALALRLALDAGVDVLRAIHFYHRWSWDIPRMEARRISRELGVDLLEIDITEELLRRVLGSRGKPCKICKKIMKQITVRIARELRAEIIITGESAMDRISGVVLQYIRERGLGYDEMELTPVPKWIGESGILVLRPLIRLTDEDASRLARKLGIVVRRVGEVGDRPKLGWREGCPLQYIEYGVEVSEDLLDLAYEANREAVEAARELGIRASVLVPSLRVITIPEGFEEEIWRRVDRRIRELNLLSR